MSNHDDSIPIETDDDVALRRFGGYIADGKTTWQLPSGRILQPDEAQAFASMFSDEPGDPDINRKRLIERAIRASQTAGMMDERAMHHGQESQHQIGWLARIIYYFRSH